MNNNFLLIGYGRWSKIYIKTLLRYFPKKNLFVYSKTNFRNLKKEKKVLNENKIKTLETFFFDKQKKYILIICNKSTNKEKYIKFAQTNKIDCICEKPFLLGKNKMEMIIKNFKKNKTKFLLSIPWIFNNNIQRIAKKNKYEFNEIKIDWHEKDNIIKYGLKKTFDKNINFYQDVISHIICLLYKFFKGKKIKIIFKSSSLFYFKKKKIILSLKKNSKKNMRKISFYKNNQNVSSIFLGKDIRYFINKKNYFYKDKKRDLDKMILYFIKNDYKKIFKDYSNLFVIISKLTRG